MIPPELKKRPFTLREAQAAGLTRRALAGKSWRRLGSSLYCWSGLREDTWQLLHAWHRRLPSAIFTGLSAAWLHRLDVNPCNPIEMSVGSSSGIRSRPGLVVRRRAIPTSEVIRIRDLPATDVNRTLRDICRQLPAVEALVVLDAALRARITGRLNMPLGMLAEPAESPMETRLRWLLIQAGLPRPQVQTNLHDTNGRFLGRADLYYPSSRLVIEYDGANHRDRMIEDLRRQNAILSAGYRLLRFSAADVNQRPDSVVAQVAVSLQTTATGIASERPSAPS